MPECALNLSQAAVYLALAPKSNASCAAISRREDVREQGAELPPAYLQDAHYPGARKLGRGTGYEYPHDLPEGVSDQPLLPEGLQDRLLRAHRPGLRGEVDGTPCRLRKRLRKPALSLYSVKRQMGSIRLRQGPQQHRLAGISWRSTLLGLVLGVALLVAAPSAWAGVIQLRHRGAYVLGRWRQQNNVTVPTSGLDYLVTDSVPIDPASSSGCV